MSIATSQLAVANEALAKLKQIEGITAISDGAGTTTAQKYVTRFFETCRKGVLRAHDWPFSRKRLCIVASYSEENGRWTFPLPTDCIRAIAVTAQGEPVSYEIEGVNIISLQQPDTLVYSYNVEDIDLWDTISRHALVHLLASELAEPISGRINAWEKHFNLYKETISQAVLASARESHKHYGSRKSGSPEYPAAMSTRYGKTTTTMTTLLREIPE